MANATTVLTPEILSEIAKRKGRSRKELMAAVGKAEWDLCADDFEYWVDASRHVNGMPYVYTLDPKPLWECKHCDPGNSHFFNKCEIHLKLAHEIEEQDPRVIRGHFNALPTIRPFTYHEYMKPIVDQWLKKQFLLVPKSRDMMATWLIVTLYTWDTLFHVGRQNIFQSQNAPKTSELVRRSHFMWRNQPAFLRDQHKVTYADGGSRSGELKIPTLESEILGFPQGPNQIRQYHPTGLFMDEAAFQDQAGDAFASIKPAIQNGGRFTAISSANPGWFMLAVQDRTEEGA